MKRVKDAWIMLQLTFRTLWRSPVLFGYAAAAVFGLLLLFGASLYPVAANIARKNPQILEPYAATVSEQQYAIERARALAVPSGIKYSSPKSMAKAIQPHWGTLLPVAALVYLLGSLIVVFFNVAMLTQVRQIANGRAMPFSYGIKEAWGRKNSIFLWALFSASIGVALQFVQSKADNWLARTLLGIGSFTWTLATFFAIPIIAVESGSPAQVLRRSAALFRKTWGETLVAEIGLGGLQFIGVIIGALPVLGLAVAILFDLLPQQFLLQAFIAGLAWMFVPPLLIGGLSTLASTIFSMVLYIYATEGAVPLEYQDAGRAWFVAQK